MHSPVQASVLVSLPSSHSSFSSVVPSPHEPDAKQSIPYHHDPASSHVSPELPSSSHARVRDVGYAIDEHTPSPAVALELQSYAVKSHGKPITVDGPSMHTSVVGHASTNSSTDVVSPSPQTSPLSQSLSLSQGVNDELKTSHVPYPSVHNALSNVSAAPSHVSPSVSSTLASPQYAAAAVQSHEQVVLGFMLYSPLIPAQLPDAPPYGRAAASVAVAVASPSPASVCSAALPQSQLSLPDTSPSPQYDPDAYEQSVPQ